MNIKHGIVILGCICALIAGCGGGNDTSDQPDPPKQLTAEGFWHGTSSTGYDVVLIALENGETWGLYTHNDGYGGALYGNTVYKGDGTFTGTGIDFSGENIISSVYSGKFVAKKSLTAVVEKNITITASYSEDYDLPPPSLASITGSYYGQIATGTTGTEDLNFSVSTTGKITLLSTGGCGGNGTIGARPSNKNIYDVSLSFNGTYCPLANGTTVTGVAIYDKSLKMMMILALNSNKSTGIIYVAERYSTVQ
jgi:hypothetical protein